MEFVVQEILRPKIESHNSYSDNDFSSLSDSDSDILATVENGDFADFLEDDCSTLDASKG